MLLLLHACASGGAGTVHRRPYRNVPTLWWGGHCTASQYIGMSMRAVHAEELHDNTPTCPVPTGSNPIVACSITICVSRHLLLWLPLNISFLTSPVKAILPPRRPPSSCSSSELIAAHPPPSPPPHPPLTPAAAATQTNQPTQTLCCAVVSVEHLNRGTPFLSFPLCTQNQSARSSTVTSCCRICQTQGQD